MKMNHRMSALLRRASKDIRPEDLPDQTGYECLINHVHFPFDGTNESLKSSLRYAVAIQKELTRIGQGHGFQVILSVDDRECTVRFHRIRPNENWIADDLEGYTEEAVLLLETDKTVWR